MRSVDIFLRERRKQETKSSQAHFRLLSQQTIFRYWQRLGDEKQVFLIAIKWRSREAETIFVKNWRDEKVLLLRSAAEGRLPRRRPHLLLHSGHLRRLPRLHRGHQKIRLTGSASTYVPTLSWRWQYLYWSLDNIPNWNNTLGTINEIMRTHVLE